MCECRNNKLKKWKENKKVLFSKVNELESFYKIQEFNKLLEMNVNELFYAEILMCSKEKYSSLGLNRQCNVLKELHSLFIFLKQESLNNILEIHFFESPDFLIFLDDNSIIGLEVFEVKSQNEHDFDKEPLKNKNGFKFKCKIFTSDKFEDKVIEKNVRKHLQKYCKYMDNVMDAFPNIPNIHIWYFLFDDDEIDKENVIKFKSIASEYILDKYLFLKNRY